MTNGNMWSCLVHTQQRVWQNNFHNSITLVWVILVYHYILDSHIFFLYWSLVHRFCSFLPYRTTQTQRTVTSSTTTEMKSQPEFQEMHTLLKWCLNIETFIFKHWHQWKFHYVSLKNGRDSLLRSCHGQRHMSGLGHE